MRVFAFALEGATDGSERLGKRKNLTCDKQVGIFRPYRVPIYALSRNCDFGHQISPIDRDPLSC